MITKTKKFFLDYLGILLIVVAYFLSYIIVNNSNEMLIFLVLTAAIGIVAIFRTRFKIKIWRNYYYIYILLFAFFCYLSSVWAINPSICIGKGNTIIEIFLLMFVINMFIREQDEPVDLLLKSIMWGGVIIVIYSIGFYGISEIRHAVEAESRLDNSLININNIGMSASYSFLICIYYMLYEKPKLWNLLVSPCVIMIALSGSRKALLIVIVGMVMLFVMKNLNHKDVLLNILKIVLVLLICTLVFLFVIQLPIFAGLKKRMLSLIAAMTGNTRNTDNSALTRFRLIEIGKDIFKENKFHGIGIDNARLVVKRLLGKDNYYLHNNYIELLADGGILGFAIYYSIYVFLLFYFLKNRDFQNKEFNICLTLLIVNLIIEYGAVTYSYKHTYIFLMMFMLHYEKSKLKRNNNFVKMHERLNC